MQNARRRNVGFLLDFFTDDYQAQILSGLDFEARKLDINLISFCGGPLNSPEEHHHRRNTVYDLIHREYLDGLVILGGSIGNFSTREELAYFYSRFGLLPVVSIGILMPNT